MTDSAPHAAPLSTALPRLRRGASTPPDMARALLLRRALSAIEVAADEVTRCIHCGATDLGRWGKSRRDLQRWRCRACERSCTAATGTALARVHSLDKLRAVAVDMLSEAPASCRKLAATLGLNRMTVWRWRKLIAAAWAAAEVTLGTAAGCVAASDPVTLRESRKASREWVRHQRDPQRYPAPDRLRWIDYRALDLPLPEPMDRYRVEVRLDAPFRHATEARAACDTCMAQAEMPARQPEAGATCGANAAHARPTKSAANRPSAGHADRGNSLVERFRHFMRPFRGPATRHLQTYQAWFLARLLDPPRR